MQLAHESILTGHLSVTSSVHKVLSEYYWQGIYKDVKRFVQACDVCKSSLQDGKTGEVSAIIESATELKNSEQQHQVSKTLQVNETIDNTTSTLSDEQAMTFNATFMVVGACQTFQNDDYSCTTLQVSEALSDVTSAKPIEKCATVQVSTSRSKQNENEALMERQPTEDGRKTVCIYQERKVNFCNISDECKTSPDDFDRKYVLVWNFSFMAMMVMMMASCIGQWACTLGEIFRKGTECCSKRIRGWLLTGCFIECCRIGIVLLYMMDSSPIFKFSETVIQTMWIYVVIRDVVEGVSMISEVPDWWLRTGNRKFTMDLNGSIANHGKAIWRYVLKRSAKRSKVS